MKKISHKDFAYLMNYKKSHPFIKYCCNDLYSLYFKS